MITPIINFSTTPSEGWPPSYLRHQTPFQNLCPSDRGLPRTRTPPGNCPFTSASSDDRVPWNLWPKAQKQEHAMPVAKRIPADLYGFEKVSRHVKEKALSHEEALQCGIQIIWGGRTTSMSLYYFCRSSRDECTDLMIICLVINSVPVHQSVPDRESWCSLSFDMTSLLVVHKRSRLVD